MREHLQLAGGFLTTAMLSYFFFERFGVTEGIIGALFDCHSNWAAAHHLMLRDGQSEPPCTVLASFTFIASPTSVLSRKLPLSALKGLAASFLAWAWA